MTKYLTVLGKTLLRNNIAGLQLFDIARECGRKKFYVLWSGGGDSGVVTDYMIKHMAVDGVKAVNTGMHGTGWNEWMQETAYKMGWSLEILKRKDGKTYEDIILNNRSLRGFPHFGMHMIIMKELKLKPLMDYVRDHKDEKVCFVSGVWLEESSRRENSMREYMLPITREGNLWFIAPMWNWTEEQFGQYRKENNIPISPQNKEWHIPMDCHCGAFARPEERGLLSVVDPDQFTRITNLEQECSKRGLKYCRWGNENEAKEQLLPLEYYVCGTDCKRRE